MSIFGMMRTATSGMGAQSNKLGTVSDNIANASTHGYKRAFTEFSTVVLESGTGSYVPGSVETDVRYGITQQGGFDYTTSKTDIAVSGNGFFLVGDGSGATYLTRAGSFVKMDDGSLLNAAGYQLLGYPITNGNTTLAANGTGGLEPVSIANLTYPPKASTEGVLTANLPVGSDPIDNTTPVNTLPSGNVDPVDPLVPMAYTKKSSLTVVNSVGTLINFDVYFSKTQNANEWEMTIFPASGADATSGSFPYKDFDRHGARRRFEDDDDHVRSRYEQDSDARSGDHFVCDERGRDRRRVTRYQRVDVVRQRVFRQRRRGR